MAGVWVIFPVVPKFKNNQYLLYFKKKTNVFKQIHKLVQKVETRAVELLKQKKFLGKNFKKNVNK